ncbi:MAG: M91 family zinc metallopeptidase [Pseudomonas sp.]|uniref:M91 family zinc metallopeptidase n=1 Tax=Pseudomonas sp. TaxID=306 RepID=UPI003564DE23
MRLALPAQSETAQAVAYPPAFKGRVWPADHRRHETFCTKLLAILRNTFSQPTTEWAALMRNQMLTSLNVKAPPMLFPLVYFAATHTHTPQPAPRDKPSPYDPPSDLTPDGNNLRKHPLHTDGDVTISRLIDWNTSDPEKPEIKSSWLFVESGNHSDRIHVRSWPGDKLQILINDKPYFFDIKEKQGPEQHLWIETQGGDDTVIIDDDVKLRVDVEGGDGNDYIRAGGGRSRLYGGNGKDFLQLGSGLGYAEGNDGDDTILGGSGHAVMYGNKGMDLLIAGDGPTTKQSYLDGGDNEDVLVSGSGHTVSHGGNDDDLLIGRDRTTFYTGKGHDTILNNQRKDRIYANASDHFDRTQGSAFTEVKPSNAGEQAFIVKDGHLEFKQRVTDDLEFLRSSPLGQQTLAKMDELAVLNGGKVTIERGDSGNTSYVFGRTDQDELTPEAYEALTPSEQGIIQNGVAGLGANSAHIFYDPQSTRERADGTFTGFPVTGLFHEIGHAYNGATGTFLAGESTQRRESGRTDVVPHLEHQVVGLPSDAEPFDLDNDPATPPSTINPKPFTENGLLEEMGKPLRKSYRFDLSAQGDGL